MIEVSKVHYDVIAITEKKVQLNITQAVEGLGWEEEEDELAMKITFELYNAKYNGSRLSSLIKIGCVVAIKAYWGSGKGIVAMGNVTECERSTTKADEVLMWLLMTTCTVCSDRRTIFICSRKGHQERIDGSFQKLGHYPEQLQRSRCEPRKDFVQNSYLGDVVRGILDEAKKKAEARRLCGAQRTKFLLWP